MFASSIVALSIAAFASASPLAASLPLAARGTCSPSFDGEGLRVVQSGSTLEFGPSAAKALAPIIASSFRGAGAVDWHFQQTGQPTVGYIIRDVANGNLAVSARNDGSILLDKASDSGNVPDQIWTVQCNTCSTGVSGRHGQVASQCIIRSSALHGGCVTLGPTAGSPGQCDTSVEPTASSPAHVTNDGACTTFDFFTN
ncbi:hypothetical protein BDZ89DRAFT_1064773 [Hymenopellis radicata]|nr:hypothetical protein BDZ89DRAFT_1064773 [Hymenopellis radicata]